MPRFRVKDGEKEFEVEGEESFVEKHLDNFLKRTTLGTEEKVPIVSTASASRQKITSPDHEPSPAEFYRMKKPNGGTRALAVLAAYLRNYRKEDPFKRQSINALCAEIRIKNIHPQYYTRAIQQGLVREIGDGLALTMSGEDLVRQMGSASENASIVDGRD